MLNAAHFVFLQTLRANATFSFILHPYLKPLISFHIIVILVHFQVSLLLPFFGLGFVKFTTVTVAAVILYELCQIMHIFFNSQ